VALKTPPHGLENSTFDMRFFCNVAASLMLVAFVGGATPAFSQTSPSPQKAPAVVEPPAVWSKPPTTPNDSLVSPEVAPDGRVTFRLYAPEASNVSLRVNSDFGKGPIKFVKAANGVWSATSAPAPAGAYRYNFMVDGATVLDDRNPYTSAGVKTVQSVVEVSGGADDLQANQPGIEHGTISTVYYDSPVAGAGRRLHIYLPANYEKGRNYPVLYLLHGGGDDDDSWPTVGRPNFILDNLIGAGKAKPMVIVFPNGSIHGNLQQVKDPDQDPFTPELLTVIIPYIESHYRVSQSPDDRAIAGLSLGGHQTLYTGLTHTELFHTLVILSSGLPNQKAFEKKYGPTLTQEASRLKLVWYGYGTRDPAKPNALATLEMFDRYGIKYQAEEVPGTHDWSTWRLCLGQFAPLLFR
jgi:enterochelin esterase family protein